MIKNVNKWLKQAPKEAIEILVDGKKVQIIPEKEIESLLDQLTDCQWDTINFKSSVRRDETKFFMDASLELVVRYKDSEGYNVVRTLTGAVTFDIAYFSNTHHNNTAKSLCISNAASDLGRRFGKDLNPSVFIGMQQPENHETKTYFSSKMKEAIDKISEPNNL